MMSAGAVAKPGSARKIGAQSREIRKRIAAVRDDKPVLAPALIPTADSAKVVVVLVPIIPPIKVAMESASNAPRKPGIVPSFFINGVLTTAPLMVPTVSKKSAKRKEKMTTRKLTENSRLHPVFSGAAEQVHSLMLKADPKSEQKPRKDSLIAEREKFGNSE